MAGYANIPLAQLNDGEAGQLLLRNKTPAHSDAEAHQMTERLRWNYNRGSSS